MFPLPRMSQAACWFLQRRCKSKVHWAKARKKTGPTHKAMDHFDDFYGSVFGKEKWESMRKALLRHQKYVALVNNYGNTEETIEMLTNKGAHCVKKLIEVDREFREAYHSGPPESLEPKKKKTIDINDAIRSYSAKVQEHEISELYPEEDSPDRLEAPGVTLKKQSVQNETTEEQSENSGSLAYNASLDKSLSEAELDESRIINASIGLSSQALWQYVPATKLKGMEDWVPESQHYSYYSQGKDFPLTVEPENDFSFPEHLKVFTYEVENVSLFPQPRRSDIGVMNYYPMDGASILPILALSPSTGDRILDLCAAPGGKTLAMLQTLLPDIIVCNDISISRTNRMRSIFRDYLPDFMRSNRWTERVLTTNYDGRYFQDGQLYDKVLVDVPCTTDRHSATEPENNMFRSDRTKERLRIPEMQSHLLVNGLRLVKPGGTVVYSTCTLSPIQNDGVVHMALRRAFEQHGIQAVIKDLSESMAHFRSMMRFGIGSALPRYGTLVTPHVAANFGPGYFSKIVEEEEVMVLVVGNAGGDPPLASPGVGDVEDARENGGSGSRGGAVARRHPRRARGALGAGRARGAVGAGRDSHGDSSPDDSHL